MATATIAKNKWTGTIKRLKVLPEDTYLSDSDVPCLKISGLVKANLRIAAHYLWQMDEIGKAYTVPFDREKFEWLLKEPIGKNKLKEAIEIKHECAKMAGW